jgi:hypothetical protein
LLGERNLSLLIYRALELLYSLKAVDINGELTPEVGSKLAELPVEPRLGVLLITSGILFEVVSNQQENQNLIVLRKLQCWLQCCQFRIFFIATRKFF